MRQRSIKEIFIRKISGISGQTNFATVYLLHRVDYKNSNNLSGNENMKITPSLLEQFIISKKKQDHVFCSVSELKNILTIGGSLEKKIVMTLDDGYLDNFLIAYPIFKKYNIPFTIFVTPSFIEGTKVLWWYYIEDKILRNDNLLFNGELINISTFKDKNLFFFKVRDFLLKRINSQNSAELLLQKHFDFKYNEIENFSKSYMMNWAMIKDLVENEKLFTLGGHTLEHLPLANLSKFESYKQIVDGNMFLLKQSKKDISAFAYPFGSPNEASLREFKNVKKTNLDIAFTTRYGNVYALHRFCTEALPRIELTDNYIQDYISNI